MFDEGLLSTQEFDQQRTSGDDRGAVQLAKAQEEQSEAGCATNIQLEQTKVYTPLSGIVALRYVDEGAVVSPTQPIVRSSI